jgi:hypothetical protein
VIVVDASTVLELLLRTRAALWRFSSAPGLFGNALRVDSGHRRGCVQHFPL